MELFHLCKASGTVESETTAVAFCSVLLACCCAADSAAVASLVASKLPYSFACGRARVWARLD